MKICVFCGSAMGNNPIYKEKATDLGKIIAKNGHTLIYGGSNIGTMRVIADAALNQNGHVIGIMPQTIIDKKIAYEDISEFYPCDTMAERKIMMEQMSDAFIVMPGGFGTFDEMFEIFALNQLHIINKPIILYNTNNYFDKLYEFISQCTAEGFITEEHKNSMLLISDENEIIQSLNSYKFKHPKQWVDKLISDTENKLI